MDKDLSTNFKELAEFSAMGGGRAGAGERLSLR
jgi:hypothetical protein